MADRTTLLDQNWLALSAPSPVSTWVKGDLVRTREALQVMKCGGIVSGPGTSRYRWCWHTGYIQLLGNGYMCSVKGWVNSDLHKDARGLVYRVETPTTSPGRVQNLEVV